MTDVLITRTQPGAAQLARELRRAGIESSVRSLIEIEKIRCCSPEKEFDLAVYLSQHAVACSDVGQASAKRHLAIGSTTQRALAAKDIESDVSTQASSEELLQEILHHTEEIASVLVVCGEDGRVFLVEKLKEMGYSVDTLVSYRRKRSRMTITDGNVPSIVEISSLTALKQFTVNLRPHADSLLGRLKLVVPSLRIGAESRKNGYPNVYCAGSASTRSYLRLIRRLVRSV